MDLRIRYSLVLYLFSEVQGFCSISNIVVKNEMSYSCYKSNQYRSILSINPNLRQFILLFPVHSDRRIKSIICTKLAINNEESERTKEYSTSCMGHLPETCIIVSQERMLLPGMTTRLHLYDLNNIAALEDALSRDGTFSLVRF